jgi:hypothetical protein
MDADMANTQQYPAKITLDGHLQAPAGGTIVSPVAAAARRRTPDLECQPMASQWAAIHNLRDETASQYQRLQQLLCRNPGDATISRLLNVYPDAQSIRNKGAQLVKDVLEGFQPRGLSLVFAFTSFAYAISQLLYKNGHIDKSEILADLNAWRGLIPDMGERQAFDLIAQTLWPEAKNHLHFIPVPTISRNSTLYDEGLLWSSSARREPSGDQSTCQYPPDWVQPSSLDGLAHQPYRSRASDVPGEREQLGSVKPVGTKVRLDDTGMFLAVIVFLQDIAELVYILSGSSLSSRRHKLYKAEEREQDAFYKNAREIFFAPRYDAYNAPNPEWPAFFALLSVAETFTKDGLLRSISEVRHYLASVAPVSQALGPGCGAFSAPLDGMTQC